MIECYCINRLHRRVKRHHSTWASFPWSASSPSWSGKLKTNFVISLQNHVLYLHYSNKPHDTILIFLYSIKGPPISWRKFLCNLLNIQNDSVFYDNLLDIVSERVGSQARYLKTNIVIRFKSWLEEIFIITRRKRGN